MPVMIVCQRCGKEINVPPSRRHTKYCSMACRHVVILDSELEKRLADFNDSHNDVKLIPLTQNMTTMVDSDDYARLSQFRWHVLNAPNTYYAVRNVPIRIAKKKRKWISVLMHKDITGFSQTDHADGDGLNNRRANLRVCTISQNGANRGAQKNNTSGFKGVSWHAARGRWRAVIGMGGKQIHLGHFEEAAEAAAKYDEVAIQLYGAFAKTNGTGRYE